jgi:hypothetical protein
MSRGGRLHKVSRRLEPPLGATAAVSNGAGVVFFGMSAALGVVLNAGVWPAGWPLPPVPLPVPAPVLAVLVVAKVLTGFTLAADGRRWVVSRRIARLTADPRVDQVLPLVEAHPTGPFAPVQPLPVVTFPRIRRTGRVRPRHRVTAERNVVGLPPLRIVYLRAVENEARSRTFAQGAWREFGQVHLLRSAASVGPGEFRAAARDGRLSELVVGSETRFRAQCAPPGEPLAAGWHRVCTVAGAAVTTFDRHGAYPVSTPTCSGAFWTRGLDILFERADLVVLDLSGYDEHVEGTQVELQRIVDRVPVEKVLLLGDPRSRPRFLQEQVHRAWAHMAAGSPNAGRGVLEIRGALVDRFGREEGSSSPARSARLRASRRQTRWLLRDVQHRMAASRPTSPAHALPPPRTAQRPPRVRGVPAVSARRTPDASA